MWQVRAAGRVGGEATEKWETMPRDPGHIIAVLALPSGVPVLLLYAMPASAAVAGSLLLAALLCCAGLAVHSLLGLAPAGGLRSRVVHPGPRWSTRP
jgi:hypothetical protein